MPKILSPFRRAKNNVHGVIMTRKLIEALEKLRRTYPDFHCELDISCTHSIWVIGFKVRTSIPYRDKKFTLTAEDGTSLPEALLQATSFLKQKVPLLNKEL